MTKPAVEVARAEEIANWIMQNAGGLQNKNILDKTIAQALIAFGKEQREAGLEEAAKVCDEIVLKANLEGVPQPGAMSAAFKIRSLKERG